MSEERRKLRPKTRKDPHRSGGLVSELVGLWGPDLADYSLTGQHGDDTEDGGDLLAGEGEEGGDQGHEGLGCCH